MTTSTLFLRHAVNNLLKLLMIFAVLQIAVPISLAQTSPNNSDEVKKLKEQNTLLQEKLKLAENQKRLQDLEAENQKRSQASKNSKNPIDIKVEQPNIWTLEQAHYLLAQMHRRNLDLRTSPLKDLDPNAINGVNIDVLKTLLSVSAEFDQSIGANNNITRLNNAQIRDEKQFIAEQRRTLLVKRSELQNSSLRLTSQIADLKIKHLRSESEDEKKKIQDEIDELTIVQEVVKEQLTLITQVLGSLSATDKDFQTFTTTTPSTESSNALTSVLATVASDISDRITNHPQLNASVRLDNYIQMQYEILSKQLTLLRDEVGPGERLVFMELPQSLNVSYGESKNKLAQSWWKIRGYSQCMIVDQIINTRECTKLPEIGRLQNRMELTSKELVERLLRSTPNDPPLYDANLIYVQSNELSSLKRIIEILVENKSSFTRTLSNEVKELRVDSTGTSTTFQGYVKNYNDAEALYDKECASKPIEEQPEKCLTLKENYQKSQAIIENLLLKVFRSFMDSKLLKNYTYWSLISDRVKNANATTRSEPYQEIYFRRLVLEEAFNGGIENWRDVWQKLVDLDDKGNPTDFWSNYENRTIRAVDLFPRQNSLNVNDIKLRSNQFSGKAIFSFLSGFGAKTNYERMRERYSQFVQQELYSSAFGKGGREFGWTFFPMPGTERLMSGVRTTYAVLIVPEETTALILETKGCYFPRSSMQPREFADATWENKEQKKGCTEPKKLLVPLPNGGNPHSNSFSVNRITYRSVPKGAKAVVSIGGEDFSSQIGLLIDGVPLSPSIGLGQPFIRDDSEVGKSVNAEIANNKIKGSFERISQHEIIATFEMGADYQGTPVITLVAPGTSLTLNSYDIQVSDGKNVKKNLAQSNYIFGRKVGEDEKVTTIESFEVFLVHQELLRIMVKGEYLDVAKKIFINGLEISKCGSGETYLKNRCYEMGEKGHYISLSADTSPQVKTIKFTIATDLGTLDSASIANPSFNEATKSDPVLAKYDVIKKEFAFDKYEQVTCATKGDKVESLFRISGKGFTSNTKAYINNKAQSVTLDGADLLVTIINPELKQTVLLQDPELKRQDEKIVIFNKPEKGCP